MKSILEDMHEELALLKDENRKLREDNLSGQSLVTRSKHHGELLLELPRPPWVYCHLAWPRDAARTP